MAIHEKLLKIQSSINVPKNQHNKFGDYNYRSCEDILSALKPLLKEAGCTLTVNDDLVFVGDWHYIESTAILYDCESGESILNKAYAREEESKKGMDSSQITGAASSYARKYALNGLLLLDDVKDADTNENHQQRQNANTGRIQSAGSNRSQQQSQNTSGVNKGLQNDAQKKAIDKKTLETLRKRLKDHSIDEKKVCGIYKISELGKLSVAQYEHLDKYFENIKGQCAA